jgi:hypothetical protein
MNEPVRTYTLPFGGKDYVVSSHKDIDAVVTRALGMRRRGYPGEGKGRYTAMCDAWARAQTYARRRKKQIDDPIERAAWRAYIPKLPAPDGCETSSKHDGDPLYANAAAGSNMAARNFGCVIAAFEAQAKQRFSN